LPLDKLGDRRERGRSNEFEKTNMNGRKKIDTPEAKA
jgi:hypothetical protein